MPFVIHTTAGPDRVELTVNDGQHETRFTLSADDALGFGVKALAAGLIAKGDIEVAERVWDALSGLGGNP